MMYLFKNGALCFLHDEHLFVGSQAEVISYERNGCDADYAYYEEAKDRIVHHIVDCRWQDGGECHYDEYS